MITDPNATIAWSGNLQPEFRTDISIKSFFGRGSGESIQMQFRGEGFVVVQPYEEIAFQRLTISSPGRAMANLPTLSACLTDHLLSAQCTLILSVKPAN